MNPGSSPYVALGIPIALVVSTLFGVWAFQKSRSRRRTEQLQAQAQALGFNFEGEGWTNRRLAPPLETALFSKGHTPQFKNVMTGNLGGLKVSIFDYVFVEGSGRGTRRCGQTVGAFSKSDVYFPYFELQPSGILEKLSGDLTQLWGDLTHKTIHFDSDPDFSKHYVLRGALNDKVRAFFNPTLRSFVKTIDPHEKWRIEGSGETLILYRYAKKVPPTEMRMFVDQAILIANSFLALSGCQSSFVENGSTDSYRSPIAMSRT